MGQLNLFVGGMSCRRCVREVTALVRDVTGVETVSANARDCVVRLTGSMQAADVLTAFAGTSYRLRLDDTRLDDTRLDDTRLDDTRTGPMGGDSGETAVGKPSR